MTERLDYGTSPEEFAELSVPTGDSRGVVVLLHGGFWRARRTLDLMRPLAADLAARGWAAVNLEYRRVGHRGGGWPGTFHDVRTALERLPELIGGDEELDARHPVIIGHSAGATLALWVAAHLAAQAPAAIVGLAGVCDLAVGARAGTGDGAIGDLLEGDLEQAAAASPSALDPGDVPTLLVHGTADRKVPVSQSRDHHARLLAHGIDATLLELPDVGHMELIDPTHPSWAHVVDWIGQVGARGTS